MAAHVARCWAEHWWNPCVGRWPFIFFKRIWNILYGMMWMLMPLSFWASGGDWGVENYDWNLFFKLRKSQQHSENHRSDSFTVKAKGIDMCKASSINGWRREESLWSPRKHSSWSEREKIEIFQPLAMAGIGVCHQPRTVRVEVVDANSQNCIHQSINIPINIAIYGIPISHSTREDLKMEFC